MKTKQARKFSHFVLATTLAGALMAGIGPTPLRSQDDDSRLGPCLVVVDPEAALFCFACRNSWLFRWTNYFECRLCRRVNQGDTRPS